MELVYLWVEDYKNIHRQGFNFSPRFKCEFKAVYKKDENANEVLDEENSELIIDENDNYIENFFGENINVTAIVGKNGSGKSSVLKLILYLIFCKNYKKHEKDGGRLVYTLRQFPDKELFLLIRKDGEFKKIVFSNFIKHLRDIEFGDETTTKVMSGSAIQRDELLPDIKELTKEELDFFTIHFNYMLDTLYDGFHDNWIKEIYHKADNYETPLLLEPYKNNNDKQLINLEIIEYLNNQNMLRFYSLSKHSNIVVFFKPNKLKIEFSEKANLYQLNPLESGEVPSEQQTEKYGMLQPVKIVIYKYFKLKNEQNKGLLKIDYDLSDEIDNLYKNKEYKKINKLYIIFKTLESNESLFNKDVYMEIKSAFNNVKNLDSLLKIKIDNLLLNDVPSYEIYKIKIALDFENKGIYKKEQFKNAVNETNRVDDIRTIMNFLPSWLDVEWFEDNKSIKSLSSGEKSLLTFIINLMYQVKNINDKNEYKTTNLFLDETELGFHPQWQKVYLRKIISALNQINNKKINLIFATHSPFLLSDIPKQNIIFLDTDENGNCIVVKDGLKDKKETFGANIHTLLSDSFFMEDGLIGEFAKSKIDEVIKLLNKEQLSNDEIKHCEQIISIIGEPIIKNQLQKMLDSKRLSKIDLIEKKIKNMTYELEILKKHQAKIVRRVTKQR